MIAWSVPPMQVRWQGAETALQISQAPLIAHGSLLRELMVCRATGKAWAKRDRALLQEASWLGKVLL